MFYSSYIRSFISNITLLVFRYLALLKRGMLNSVFKTTKQHLLPAKKQKTNPVL